MSKLVNNIYDIDGNIIRKAGEGRFTIEETEQLVDDLTKKVQENPDNEVYKVYLNNAQKWLMHLYDNMSREDLMKRMSIIQDSIKDANNEATSAEQTMLDEVNKAVEELKKEYENENTESDIAPTEPETGGEPELAEEVEQPVEESAPLTQEDMLVERDSAPIEMEEVIDA